MTDRRRFLTLRFDVTGLPEFEVDALGFEASVQAERSDEVGLVEGHDGAPTWTGHRDVSAPEIILDPPSKKNGGTLLAESENAQGVRVALYLHPNTGHVVYVGGWPVATLKTERGALRRFEREENR
jgi:hypothetical protein